MNECLGPYSTSATGVDGWGKAYSQRSNSLVSSSVVSVNHSTSPLLSAMEYSNNENNRVVLQRQTSNVSQQHSHTSSSLGVPYLSSSLANGNGLGRSHGGQYSQSVAGSSTSGASTRRSNAMVPSTTISEASSAMAPVVNLNPALASGTMGSSINNASGSPDRQETVMIEEKRPRRFANGQIATGENAGYTVHRYLRGRLLGKGGFAKVYLCTAMDTNKNYAVKVVAKSNLTKARARQKVGVRQIVRFTLSFFYISGVLPNNFCLTGLPIYSCKRR
jgi:hypothetical protein